MSIIHAQLCCLPVHQLRKSIHASGSMLCKRSGSIVATCGSASKEITVTIPAELDDIRGHWAETYIRELFGKGIVTGVSATRYAPSANIKRGDFVLMLYRTAGSPSVSGSCTFSDVKADAYYAKALTWAQQQDIAKGDNGVFHPTNDLSRQEAFALIHRACGVLHKNLSAGDSSVLDSYNDKDRLSSWAVQPAVSLIASGIIQGSAGHLNPRDPLTRAEMAKILSCVLNY